MAKMNYRKLKEQDRLRQTQISQWEKKAHKLAMRKAALAESEIKYPTTKPKESPRMLNQPKPKTQPTPGAFTKALDTIFEGKVPDSMLRSHEERPKTLKEAKDALYDIVATIRDKAKQGGFQYILKPKWLSDQEAKDKDRF